ncbi:MAG: class I SAM-dependent methyltransferase [Candidatus Sericytochromatia bacterium]|nr:class I SAM-dependent methyltransferase [Candidatus Sericytochromatia bacterium]
MRDSGELIPAHKAPYEGYAEIYDRTGQGRFGLRMLLWARDYWGGHWPSSIVDLACGAGQVAVALGLRGVRTAGVDRSPAMLDLARKRARRAGVEIPWFEADLRDTPVLAEGPYDAATCFYDALNTCLSEAELEACLRGMAAWVRPGGELIVDLITDFGIREVWGHGVDVREGKDTIGLWRSSWHAARRVGRLDLTYFVQDGERGWQRFDERHEHRGWDPVEVQATMVAAGWTVERMCDGMSLEPPAADSYRVTYVARRRDE